jgi:cold-inducible RNA-binding protein
VALNRESCASRIGLFQLLKGEKMQKKLYVGGLSYNTDVEEIQQLFVQAGEIVSATIIKDKFTNQSRGFGFVEMATEEQAAEAIKLFNGKELGGRSLTVNESKPQEKRNFSGGGFGGKRKEPRW